MSAYLHVLVLPDQYKFLRFHYKDITYELTVLPFSLSTAHENCESTRGTSSQARDYHIHVSRRLARCGPVRGGGSMSHVHDARSNDLPRVYRQRGKSCPTPTLLPIFLGAEIDLQKGIAGPSHKRVANLRQCVQLFLQRTSASALAWLRLLGLMASMVDLVGFCRLRMRPLQLHLLAFYRLKRDKLGHMIPIPCHIHPHLRWWLQEANAATGLSLVCGKEISNPFTSTYWRCGQW